MKQSSPNAHAMRYTTFWERSGEHPDSD